MNKSVLTNLCSKEKSVPQLICKPNLCPHKSVNEWNLQHENSPQPAIVLLQQQEPTTYSQTAQNKHTELGRRHTGSNNDLLARWDQVMSFQATATERAPFSMSRGLLHSWDEGVWSPARILNYSSRTAYYSEQPTTQPATQTAAAHQYTSTHQPWRFSKLKQQEARTYCLAKLHAI